MLAACTDATLGVPPPPPVPAADNQLAVEGAYCTQAAAAAAFPVKIVFVVDLSNSMCYTDPASGACSPARCDQGPNNPATNPTPPRRAQAVQAILDKYAGNTGVSFAMVTFSSSIHVYPYDTTSPHVTFTRDQSQLRVAELRNVDSVTDYQGALSRVKALLSDDMTQVAARRKSELPRTKYAVIFLTDGVPFPHCSRGDPSRNNPPDQAGCPADPAACTICQRGGTPGLFPDLGAGEDYNEPYQLQQVVDEIHRLGESYAVGDLKLHAAQLFTDNATQCCPVCFADDPDGSHAAQLLQSLAEADQGRGSYVLFRRAEDLSFVDYDFTSLQEKFVTRSIFVQHRNQVATPKGLMVDTDGDGIPDDEEFAMGLDRLKADTDGDGYSDLFEVRYKALGFDPLVSQKARCQANSSKCPGRTACDTDGDGLTDCEEAELGTDPELIDSDADGIPDGMEVRLGLDPTRDDAREDLDFDGVSNQEEVLTCSAPAQPDTRAREGWTVRVSADETTTDAQGRVCYTFAARGLQLASPMARPHVRPSLCPTNGSGPSWCFNSDAFPVGWSDTYLWLGEAPRGDLRDYGRWRVACVRARWVPPNVRLPVEPIVSLADADFKDPATFLPDRDCKGAHP